MCQMFTILCILTIFFGINSQIWTQKLGITSLIVVPCVCKCIYTGECRGESSQKMVGANQMECSFNSVYPDGIINWFRDDKNVTSSSTITSLENSDGTINISSILNIQNNQKIYKCSLWSIKNGRYFKDQEFEVEVGVSAGSRASSRTSTLHCLSWYLLLLVLMFSLRYS